MYAYYAFRLVLLGTIFKIISKKNYDAYKIAAD